MTPSTSTIPVVRDRAYWTQVIHNAAKVTPDHPRYGEARQVVQLALDNLDNVMQQKSAADPDAQVPMPSKTRGVAMNALQGLTLGFGDEALGGIAGLGTLLTGGSSELAANRVQQTQQGFNEQRGAFFGEHPALAIGGDIVGTLQNPLNKVLGPLTEGLGPIAKGITIGTTLGGVRGFGEASGSPRERLPGAVTGAVVGGVTGAGLGAVSAALLKGVKAIGPSIGKLTENARRMLGKGAPQAEVDNSVEVTIRARLTKLGVAPEDIERAVQSWRRTGELSVRRLTETPPPPPPPPTVRPGETITPIAPKGFAVTGPRATPPEGPYPPSIAEMQGFPTTARGVGGHSYTGTYPAGTAANVPGRTAFSPSGGPGPQALQLQQLQTLAQMPAAQFEEVAGLFPQEIIQQLRTIRTQFGLGQ